MASLVEQIDELLPQTQCGQCSYAGCQPYAEAIANHREKINRCPPGGIKTLTALGELLRQDITPYITGLTAQNELTMLAYIREAECIGCTKCIQACPVDAIIGSAKQLHTVLKDECTGCGLCVTPCPVDCIDMVKVEKLTYQPAKAKQRFYNRKLRMAKVQQTKTLTMAAEKTAAQKAYIAAAVARAKNKKSNNCFN